MDQVLGRPLGVKILSPLHIMTGVLLLFILVISQLMGKGDKTIPVGFTTQVTISVIVIGILSVGSGIGMWLRARWGWKLGTAYHIYAICRYVNALTLYPQLLGGQNIPQQTMAMLYAKVLSRILISSLILGYFFKQNVLSYFGLHESKQKVIEFLFWEICSIVGLSFLVSLFLQ